MVFWVGRLGIMVVGGTMITIRFLADATAAAKGKEELGPLYMYLEQRRYKLIVKMGRDVDG